MIYILDAYNVIHKIRRLEAALDKDLRAGRDALMAACGRLAENRGDIAKIILVFDGKSEFRDLAQSSPPKINLVFSETGEAADERIVTILEELGDKTSKCVVSDDNFVRNHARAYKTRVMPVAEFERFLEPGAGKHNRPGSAPSSALPQKLADEITAAYKKHLGLG